MAVDSARAKLLFLAASELSSLTERAAYLERACGGDSELLARVAALLEANDASPQRTLQDKGLAHTTTGHDADRDMTSGFSLKDELADSVIDGKYILIEVIG